jgi:hypothetical protein
MTNGMISSAIEVHPVWSFAAELVFTLMIEKFPFVLYNREPYLLRLTEPG